jgi:hypothetical protein
VSDQQATGIGVVLDLEELFRSREFGRRPARLVPAAPATVASEPAQLEQVLLADVFGRPNAVAAAVRVLEESAPALSGQPTLVLLSGGGEAAPGRDTTHPQHRAIAAVSGVAAAALAMAGVASGPGQGPGRAPVTQQAQGAPNPSRTGSGGGSQLGPVGPTVLPNPSNTGTPGTSVAPGGGGTNAALTAYTTPVAAGSPQGSTGGGAAPPPAAPAPGGGGSSPGTPPGNGGGGSMLTPALNVAGNEVSGAGSSASSTAGDVSQAAVRPVATSAVNNLGGGTPPNIAGALNQ